MWIRDSVNQILHLVPFMADAKVNRVVCGVLARLTDCILLDPFANAFNFDLTASSSEHSNDFTNMRPGVFERKFELDSWASYIRLVNAAGNRCGARASKVDIAVLEVLGHARKLQALDTSAYAFQRDTREPTETLRGGSIMPAAFTGMIPSAFRPSDDACQLPFHIPANAFFSVELEKLRNSPALSGKARTEASILAAEIRIGIEKNGKVSRGKHFVYAYEVDGYGSAIFMDDANLPSLLSLPLMGYLQASDRVYQRTREFLLATGTNPWYFKGAVAGIGSPHTGRGRVWPLALMTQFLTSSEREEKGNTLDSLVSIGRVNGLFFESVNVAELSDYTRADFGWANSFFALVVLDWLALIK